MKTTYGWGGDGNGTNTSGFSGLPGGARVVDSAQFAFGGLVGAWWSSSPNGSYAWARFLSWGGEDVVRSIEDQRNDLSVRCIKDNQ